MAVRGHVLAFHADYSAAAKLAVDREIEQGRISRSAGDLKSRPYAETCFGWSGGSAPMSLPLRGGCPRVASCSLGVHVFVPWGVLTNMLSRHVRGVGESTRLKRSRPRRHCAGQVRRQRPGRHAISAPAIRRSVAPALAQALHQMPRSAAPRRRTRRAARPNCPDSPAVPQSEPRRPARRGEPAR